jgi:glucose uptake protein
MFIVNSYTLAVVLCIITMFCWGSWGNTQKLASKTWRYELYYWDYVIGILLFSLLVGFTLGSFGTKGVSFLTNLGQVASNAILSAFIGGVIFNGSNILLSSSISISGMTVAFPVGVGLALVLGVSINFLTNPQGNPILLFAGVTLVVIALIFNGIAAGKNSKGDKKRNNKGILLAIIAGVLMSFFYYFVAAAMDLKHFDNPDPGKATPYVAFFIFAVGIFVSNFLFNTILMKKPIEDEPVKYATYFHGKITTHLVGILGGVIWGLGTILNYISSGQAGTAISYALGQGAPMIAALWGVFIWKEFKGCGITVNIFLTLMFVLFLLGLGLIVVAGGN